MVQVIVMTQKAYTTTELLIAAGAFVLLVGLVSGVWYGISRINSSKTDQALDGIVASAPAFTPTFPSVSHK